MRLRNSGITRLAALILILSGFAMPAVYAQQASQQKPAGQADEVVRIKTELVQTDVTVLDKRGRFVEGLRPEQFELSVGGKAQTISFFELVKSGSDREATQLRTARGDATNSQPAKPLPVNHQGRLVFFFLDDEHLSPASITRARKALVQFVATQMGQDDQVAIVSTSGRIGFLQQLTDNKVVLQTAIARLANKPTTENYSGRTRISDYQANQVVEHNDRDLLNYLISSTMNEFMLVPPKGGDPRGLAMIAANVVKNRTRQIEAESKVRATNTLAVLESLLRSSAPLPGRKLVFFISDGFITDVRSSNAMVRLKRVTDMAARVNAVFYAMDARGTFNDPGIDATHNDFPDGMGSGTMAKKPSLEAAATQEPLHILADDTGGRAIINSNSFADAFQQAINETSAYYLLAWSPANEEQRLGKAKIKVTVKNRPDLRVRLRRNYYTPPGPVAAAGNEGTGSKPDSPAAQSPEAGLLSALGSLYPRRTIPTSLAAGYLSTPDQGLVLKVSMQIERNALDVAATGREKSEVDVVGAAVDDRGIIVTFKQLVTVTADAASQNSPVVWNQQLRVPPGLYQVRVAVRERSSGRSGSAQKWIEVPDVSRGQLQISSLFLGERRTATAGEKSAAAPQPVMIDVDQHFGRSSVLRYQTYVYNAARGPLPAHVEMQAQVFRDNRPVVTMPPAKLPTDTTKDLTRLPYWAEVSLNQLPPGRYLLQVTANDRTTKSSASQTAGFVID